MCGLIGHPSRNMENTGVEHDLNCADQAQEVSGEMNFSMRPIDCSCDILVKNVAGLCSFLKSLLRLK